MSKNPTVLLIASIIGVALIAFGMYRYYKTYEPTARDVITPVDYMNKTNAKKRLGLILAVIGLVTSIITIPMYMKARRMNA